MNLAQNVCFDDFYIKSETGSHMMYISRFVMFLCLGQRLSYYWFCNGDTWHMKTS